MVNKNVAQGSDRPRPSAAELVNSFLETVYSNRLSVLLKNEITLEKHKPSEDSAITVQIGQDNWKQFKIPPGKEHQYRKDERLLKGVCSLKARMAKICTNGLESSDAAKSIYELVFEAINIGLHVDRTADAEKRTWNLQKDALTRAELGAEAVEALAKAKKNHPNVGETQQKKIAMKSIKLKSLTTFYQRLKWAESSSNN